MNTLMPGTSESNGSSRGLCQPARNAQNLRGARTSFAVLASIFCSFSVLSFASAQLTPDPADRTYFGVHRPIPMTVEVPEGKTGEVRIDLFEPGKDQPISTAPAAKGQVDLAKLFPVLWSGPLPRLRFAQLVVGGEQIGAPVILQPMVSEQRAKLVEPKTRQLWFKDPNTNAENFPAKSATIEWVTEPPAYSGIRAYVDKNIVFDTSLGEIEFRLRPEEAPNTCWNFRELVKGGFYTDIIFHRIVPTLPSGHPFVVQVGDPTGTGDGGPGFSIDLENTGLKHDFGILSMARSDDPDTNGSQIFIALSREGTQRLDGRYTAFGETVRGTDTITALSKVPVKDQRPNDPPVLKSAKLVDAPPYSSRPGRVQRPVEKPSR
ncbi:MAG: peptidylprolyl isomerase [Phycisphaerales bacterium]